MNSLVWSILNAGCIYDECRYSNKVKAFFPSAKIDLEMNDTDCWATCRIGDNLDIALRGTDGTDKKAKRKAWKRNFQTEARPDGISVGFGSSVDKIFDDLDGKLNWRYYKKINIHGHSAGGGEAPALGARITEEYEIHGVECFSWAPPPTGNYLWAERFNRLHSEFGLDNLRIINPRDIVTIIYRHGDKETAGEDVGKRLDLPPDSWFQRVFKWLPGAVEHSPREYVDGTIKILAGDVAAVSELKIIRKMMVN
jgi:hypothetical protein